MVNLKDDGQEGLFPDLSAELKRWDTAFDHQKARATGVITPKAGFDPEFDQALSGIKACERDLQDYLDRYLHLLRNTFRRPSQGHITPSPGLKSMPNGELK